MFKRKDKDSNWLMIDEYKSTHERNRAQPWIWLTLGMRRW